jgi:hypothetical protein
MSAETKKSASDKAFIWSDTIDIISLSDHFRRHADFGDEHYLARILVKEGKKFCNFLTWYDLWADAYETKKGDHGMAINTVIARNRQVVEQLREIISTMVMTADHYGAKEIVLPLSVQDPHSDMIKKRILDGLSPRVKVSFQEGTYDTNLEHVGRIDHRFSTAIDEGRRGFSDIDFVLKLRWDTQDRKRPPGFWEEMKP